MQSEIFVIISIVGLIIGLVKWVLPMVLNFYILDKFSLKNYKIRKSIGKPWQVVGGIWGHPIYEEEYIKSGYAVCYYKSRMRIDYERGICVRIYEYDKEEEKRICNKKGKKIILL